MRTIRPFGILLLAIITMAACSGQPDLLDAPDERSVVRVFGNYRGQQAEDFRLVLESFTNQTGIEAAYVGTADFSNRIRERVRDGNPPDVALFPQPAVLAELARQGFVEPLSDDTASIVEDNYSDAVLPIMIVDDTLYGVWFKASVKSLVWYRPDRFHELGYSVPQTWDGLLELSSKMASDGETPWCLGMESFGATGWVGTDWIEDLVLRLHGPDVYDQWTRGEIAFTDPLIAQAFDAFGEVALQPGWVEGGTRAILTTPALRAIDPLLENPPDCQLTKQASFQILDLPAEVAVGEGDDLDVFVLPPTGPGPAPLLAAGEIAATLTGTPEAEALLAYLATPQAGEPWAAASGYTSPHLGFDPSAYASDFDRRISELLNSAQVVRFDGSDLMAPRVGTGTFWNGMIDYVSGLNLEDVLIDIQLGYGSGRTAP